MKSWPGGTKGLEVLRCTATSRTSFPVTGRCYMRVIFQRPSWRCCELWAQVSAMNSGKNGCMNVLVMVGQAHWIQCGIAPLVLLRTGTGIAAVRGHAVQNSTIDAIMHWAVRVRAVQNRPTPLSSASVE